MNRARSAILAIAVTLAALAVGWSVGQWCKPAPPAGPGPHAVASDRGPLLFQVHCASCHGTEGRGDGGSSATLPPPRDFASRPWRLEPTPESIRKVTRDGIPNAGMPSFRTALGPGELDAVVTHVHHLAMRGPILEHVPTADERLVRTAGFTDLRGALPPSLTLADAAGKNVKLSDLRGKLVLLHFWASDCPHCFKEMPALNDLAKSHAGSIAVLHVCTDEDDALAAQKILHRHVPGAASYSEPTGVGLARFEVNALPTVWLIGTEGKAIARASGARDWHSEPLRKLVAHFLPRSPATPR